MPFPVTKVLKLNDLGSEWANASISFNGLSFKQAREFSKLTFNDDTEDDKDKNLDLLVKLLGEHFQSGKAWNGTELVDLTAEDLPELPTEVLTKAIQLLSAGPDANL
jgi:hypothetical protein